MEKRAKGICIFTVIMLLLLAGRMYYIQVWSHDLLKGGALGQQRIQIQRANERGTIYDRNLIPLTGGGRSYYYMIEKAGQTVGLERLLKQIGAKPAGAKGGAYIVYRTEQFDEEINRKLKEEYGAYAFSSGDRYAGEQIAAHLIGYVSGAAGAKKQGASGLEKQFDYRLSAKSAQLSMTGNGAGQPFCGIGVSAGTEENMLAPSSLVTTIDSSIQQRVERIMEEQGITGAAVVLDTETAQVIAMASTPTFDPNRVEAYLSSSGSELVNKAVQGLYPPGSVFKLVVAAAALDSGKISPEDTYVCTGNMEVHGVNMICAEKPEGHGELTFSEGFAQSCNCFFAWVGSKIGGETIAETAEKMGLGHAVLSGFPEEETGSLPPEEERSQRGLANFSVGQGSLLVTPLQIAALTNTVAAGGVSKPVTVVRSKAGEQAQGRRVMDPSLASMLQEMMEKVCSQGTAFGNGANVKIAGKTGSAEAGEAQGEAAVHGWFTGYFPADHPKYTVTVIAENGKTGSGSALPVFTEIVNSLY